MSTVERNDARAYIRAMTKSKLVERTKNAATSACLADPRLRASFELLQEKWAMSIVHVLLHGPIGFNEVSRGAGEVNASTLAQRLLRLEEAGLVHKTVQSIMPPRTSYELTEAGRALKPVIAAIERWSERYGPASEGGGGAVA
jgi:DNA-binding HxlR family transcriptional regulator